MSLNSLASTLKFDTQLFPIAIKNTYFHAARTLHSHLPKSIRILTELI